MSKGYFTIFKGRDSQYYFNLKAGNHEIILRSEGYQAKEAAINGVESIQSNCEDKDNYLEKVSKNGKPYFVLKAQNHEIIGVSQLYGSKQAMNNGIESVMTNGVSKVLNGTDRTLYEILLNEISYDIKPGTYLGSEILQIGGFIGPRFCLFLLDSSGSRKEIKQNESLEVKSCLNFQVVRND